MSISSKGILQQQKTQDVESEYYNRLISEAQAAKAQGGLNNEIPQPLLKIALDRFGKGNKEKQQNIIQAIWILLFGEGMERAIILWQTRKKSITTFLLRKKIK